MERFFDWDYELNESARRSARLAWVVAALALLLALAAVGALASLAPLKRVEPVFVRVDSATGAIDVLHRIDEEIGLDRQDALDKGFIARYVRARESYFFPVVAEQHRRVLSMSVGEARATYERDFAPDNPQAPVQRHRDRSRVDVHLKSISFLKPGLAQVRFLAERLGPDEEREHRHRIATLEYAYEPDASIPLSVLADNPLGFAVRSYRAEPEDAPE